ncbi:MAG: glutamate--tRNA ligase [Patescibacteria group bacterium]|nr:glutamate--tRNA ligase [Patescibacteria group bacterium]MCL5224202.1 glutamate--tRNA ligase [Patescibacteria group bacterium]
MVRVRFAPSPTGSLHIGGARTALFNWLHAKSQGGHFILRIEDTDRERSTPESEADILEGLSWLGITWDEFYRQSDRIGIYREYLKKLIDDDKAYYCFCSKEDLEAERQALVAQGFPPKYSGRCRALSKEEVVKRLNENKEHVIRFKVPEREVVFKDLIRGQVKFDASLSGDVIIAKNLDQPLYNFAVTVDDFLMGITHVIRGEEHLSNTPKQILLAEAMGMNAPQFAHLPLILNTDRSKMSKRMSDVALHDYRNKGYLPQAIVNFISFLGWHPREDKDMMSLDQITSEFELNRVQKGGAIFNVDKLDWLNAHYINSLTPEELAGMAKPFMPEGYELTIAMAASVKGRIKTLAEIQGIVDLFFKLPAYDTELLKWKDMPLSQVTSNLESALTVLNKIGESDYNQANLEKVLSPLAPEGNRGELFWPLRVALSGSKASPGPFEIMEVLGKQESLSRIEKAITKAR